ncbi:MAG: toxin TcdB middle/N-terminal domain-containing protein, partial [Anaerolineae bacterium]
SDLLRRIEISYGAPVDNGDTARSSWDTLVRAYNLNYEESPFGKSLLASVDQLDSANTVVGSHEFTYYDDVTDGSNYNGLSTANSDWSPGNDSVERNLFGTFDVSALGGSETNSGDVHAYIGFNLAAPSKTGSAGGAFSVDFSNTEGIIEFIDINGDLLPDKVFRESTSGPVQYRLNQSGPDGSTSFGPAMNVINLNDLSSEDSIGFAGGPEAYLGVSVQFSIAGDVSFGREYFEDVNNDGLPDFVKDGVVYFNRLVSGVPTFATDSAGTAVPIDDGTAVIPDLPELDAVEQTQRDQSVLIDTVRRWVAPFNGTVSISGDVTLSPPAGTTSVDGVRAAIQVDGNELWNATITTPNTAVTPTGVSNINVTKGNEIYFRVGSIDDGAGDQVLWDPVITYTGNPANDVNGLSQKVYTASSDFTLAGRPDTTMMVPLDGTLRLLGDLTKGVTTDDITVEVLLNGSVQFSQLIAAGFSGTETIDTSFAVNGPNVDEVIVRVRTDTPIDVTQIDWTPSLFYTAATTPGGDPVDVGSIPNDPNVELPMIWDIDVYNQNNLTSPQTPWVSNVMTDTVVTGQFTVLPSTFVDPSNQVDDSGEFVISLKSESGLIGKTTVFVPENPTFIPTVSAGSFNASLVNGENYWFELTSRNPDLSARLIGPAVTISYASSGGPTTVAVPSTYHWAGRQGIFPIPYRGWAYAGYNAEDRVADPIDESAFVFQQSNFPTSDPTGFNDNSYQNPAEGDAYAYIPFVFEDGTRVWRGLKDNLVGGTDFASSSRSGADSTEITVPGGGGVRAVVKIGVSGPIFGIVAGIGDANVAASGGPAFGLVDYIDLNGDAYPDIVAPGYVQYTGPRGGYLDSGDPSFDTVALDTSIAVGAGFGGSAIEIKGNSEGQVNTAQDVATTSGNSERGGKSSGSSAGSGGEASDNEYGVSLGASIDVDATFTNPASATFQSDWDAILNVIGDVFDVGYEKQYADINGDDLPDRVVVSTSGIGVQLNICYGFSDPIRWAVGGFEYNEGYSGSIGPGLGFSVNHKEFSGGVAYTQGIDLSRYTWIDVDGDGVLDRLRKDGSTVKVAFGTGAGLLPEVTYGTFQDGSFDFLVDIPTGQAIAQGESTGLGGGFDFTFGIGPLCLAGCYIVINPGAHFDTSISNNQVQFLDDNGDGYPDSVKSQADNNHSVYTNNRGRTNLLSTIDNPLGGQIRLGYTLDGNTVSQPYPIWTMTSVEYDDNPTNDAARGGDGPDTLLTTYRYENNAFDSLEREFLGYATVVEEHRAALKTVPRWTIRCCVKLCVPTAMALSSRPVCWKQKRWKPPMGRGSSARNKIGNWWTLAVACPLSCPPQPTWPAPTPYWPSPLRHK